MCGITQRTDLLEIRKIACRFWIFLYDEVISEPNIIITVRRMRGEIENAIAASKAKLAEAERDHAAIVTTIRLFETRDGSNSVKAYHTGPRKNVRVWSV